jgi:hypothetical protein
VLEVLHANGITDIISLDDSEESLLEQEKWVNMGEEKRWYDAYSGIDGK